MATAPRSNRYFYGIDIIRFLAALSVAGFHLGYLNNVEDFSAIAPFTWFGWIGVEIFFVISGFVIANSANGKTPLQFIKGRARRLYPAVWCCATITMIVRVLSSNGTFGELAPSYFRSLLLLPKGPWIDDVYWTLAVEIGFYSLIFIVLLAGLFSYLSRVALALTILSSFCLSVLAARQWYPMLATPGNVIDHANVFLARHGCFFALGAWLWISSNRVLKFWEMVGVTISVTASFVEIILRGLEFLPLQIGTYMWLLSPLLVWSIAVGCILFFSRSAYLFVGRPAELIRTLGLMTYPLYLVHHVVGLTIERQIVANGIDKWIAIVLSLVPCLTISWLVRDIGQIRRPALATSDRYRSKPDQGHA